MIQKTMMLVLAAVLLGGAAAIPTMALARGGGHGGAGHFGGARFAGGHFGGGPHVHVGATHVRVARGRGFRQYGRDGYWGSVPGDLSVL
jgi:hypothetical protein